MSIDCSLLSYMDKLKATSKKMTLRLKKYVSTNTMAICTMFEAQLVYSVLGFTLYGTVLIIQLFNYHYFDSYRMAVMIFMHVIAVIIFLFTAIIIFSIRGNLCSEWKENPKAGSSGYASKQTQTSNVKIKRGSHQSWLFDSDNGEGEIIDVEQLMTDIKPQTEEAGTDVLGLFDPDNREEEIINMEQTLKDVKSQDKEPKNTEVNASLTNVTQDVIPNEKQTPSVYSDEQGVKDVKEQTSSAKSKVTFEDVKASSSGRSGVVFADEQLTHERGVQREASPSDSEQTPPQGNNQTSNSSKCNIM
ncbi:unnamed protein product [Nezara viridula]|uniref:Uncharacterized protein n=1 Tax=Nezara viridula TaxID=85310 RepID=A0A9P0ECX2_NEZVI|nr:unnamed protein product [Nezara viridula]